MNDQEFKTDRLEALMQRYEQYESECRQIGEEFQFDGIHYYGNQIKLHFMDGGHTKWKLLTPDFPAYRRLIKIVRILKETDLALNKLKCSRAVKGGLSLNKRSE